jgi:hypothetical protein
MSHNSIAQYATATRTPSFDYEWVVCPAGMPILDDGTKALRDGIRPKGASSREDCGSLRTNRAGPGVQ